jgi:hypothetical protein
LQSCLNFLKSGQEILCDEPFSLLSTHICQAKKKQEGSSIRKQNELDFDFKDLESKKKTDDMVIENIEISDSQVTTLEGHSSEVSNLTSKI